jgi:hypothetical protein
MDGLLHLSRAGSLEDFIQWAAQILLGVAYNHQLEDSLAQSLRQAGMADDRQSAVLVWASLLASPAFQWR